MSMEIRRTSPADLPRLLEIYAAARRFMAETGNPRQWGPRAWPPEALLRQDIAAGKSWVCAEAERVLGTFFLDFGPDPEPTYRVIEGAWGDPSPYGVVHRIASDGSARGVGGFCLRWALARCGHLRIDTHPDNRPMQNLLSKLGFAYRGVIHIEQDDDPRLAYEKSEAFDASPP